MNEAITKALDSGYTVTFKASRTEDKDSFTYSIILPDGCGYGRGVQMEKGDPLLSTLDILSDSLLETIEKIPKLEKDKEKHEKAVGKSLFAA